MNKEMHAPQYLIVVIHCLITGTYQATTHDIATVPIIRYELIPVSV